MDQLLSGYSTNTKLKSFALIPEIFGGNAIAYGKWQKCPFLSVGEIFLVLAQRDRTIPVDCIYAGMGMCKFSDEFTVDYDLPFEHVVSSFIKLGLKRRCHRS